MIGNVSGGTSTNENAPALDSSSPRRLGSGAPSLRKQPCDYASYVTKRDHLFRSDAQTGWRNAPNLLTARINAAGEEWSIRTDQNGLRLIAQNPRAGRRILILGDSLSFVEGIDIEDRFDVKMLSSLPGARVINTGTWAMEPTKST
jgi:hypothetical protein